MSIVYKEYGFLLIGLRLPVTKSLSYNRCATETISL